MNHSIPTLSLLLMGCGDSLISGENLETLLGGVPLPAEPAWEIRWYDVEYQQMVIDCSLRNAELVEDDVFWETLSAIPPQIATPLVWNAPEDVDYRYALAVLTLVDAERYQPLAEQAGWGDEDEENWEDVEDLSLSLERGVWGGVNERALLFAQGDLDAMAEDALLLPDSLEAAEDEAVWLGMLPELASASESISGTLYPLPDDQYIELVEMGLVITQTEHLSDASWEVLSGELLEDGVRSECVD